MALTDTTARGRRLASVDPRYGRVCACGAPKAEQHARCWTCWRDHSTGDPRDVAYWQRRTCPDCGGPKSRQSARCRRCKDGAQIGRARGGVTAQPQSHPWRRRRR